jgi:hypothetical protein
VTPESSFAEDEGSVPIEIIEIDAQEEDERAAATPPPVLGQQMETWGPRSTPQSFVRNTVFAGTIALVIGVLVVVLYKLLSQ